MPGCPEFGHVAVYRRAAPLAIPDRKCSHNYAERRSVRIGVVGATVACYAATILLGLDEAIKLRASFWSGHQ